MKRTAIKGICAAIVAPALCLSANLSYAQQPSQSSAATQQSSQSAAAAVPTNRYSMKLVEDGNGGYTLMYEKKYKKFIDLSGVPDLYVPYTHKNDRLSSKDYKAIATEEYVFKKHDGYELKIAVDRAQSSVPTPVMFYCHGGGWARGNFDASRSLSKYLAQQKGITGVRVSYSLAGQDGADVKVSVQDVLDALAYVREHAADLNVNPDLIGFYGTSAGGHLAAVAAMKCPQVKVLVGVSGIYDLTTAAIVQKTKDEQRIEYFDGRDSKTLTECSPYYLTNKKRQLSVLLFCGTADATVECSQSEEFASKLKAVNKKNKVELVEYPYYDHNLSSKTSDKMEEVFFKTVDFVAENLK